MTAETVTKTFLPEPVVDRSPELLRGAGLPRQIPLDKIGGSIQWLEITEEDIREGRKGDGASCALARAISRTFPGVTANVQGENPSIYYGNGAGRLNLARDVAEWIGKFDRGEPVEPQRWLFQINT